LYLFHAGLLGYIWSMYPSLNIEFRYIGKARLIIAQLCVYRTFRKVFAGNSPFRAFRTLPVFVFLMTVNNLFAQETDPDSVTILRKLIIRSPADTSRIRLLINLGNRYQDLYTEAEPKLDSAALLFRQALVLSNQLHDTGRKYEIITAMAVNAFENHHLDTGRRLFREAIAYYRSTRNKRLEGLVWGTMAEQLWETGQFTTKTERDFCWHRALELYQSIGDEFHALELRIWPIRDYRHDRKYDEAEKECLIMRDGFRKMKYYGVGFGWVQNMLVDIAVEKSDIYKQLFYELENLEFLIKHPRNSTVFAEEGCYYHLAEIYYNLKNFEKSELYARKQLPLVFKLRGDYKYGLNFLVMSIVKQGRPEEALTLLRKVSGEHPPDKMQWITVNKLFGNIYAALEHNKEAELYYLRAVANYKEIDPERKQPDLLASVYLRVGEFYTATHQNAKAAPFVKQLEAVLFELSPLYRSSLALMRSKVDSASGDYLSALRSFQAYNRLKDSIFTVDKTAQVNQLEVSFETKQKQNRIELLAAQNKVHVAEVLKAQTERNITIAGIALVLLILALLLYSFRNKAKSNRLLMLKKEEIDQQNLALQVLLVEKDGLLTDKDLLLREVHHRVKNNLQIVMGLLGTQLAFLENEDAVRALEESQQRVYSIALIHQKLYRGSGSVTIEMRSYIEEMIDNLSNSFNTVGKKIRFRKAITDIKLDIDQAIPVGLILNEAVTNAIKYAFDETGGLITISLSAQSGYLLLSISDNGRGLPENFNFLRSNSLGMEMIRGLGNQLKGKITVENVSGVTLTLSFPIHKSSFLPTSAHSQ